MPDIENGMNLSRYQYQYEKYQILVSVSTVSVLVCYYQYQIPDKNTSLAAKGALPHPLQRRTACKIQNGCQGAQNDM